MKAATEGSCVTTHAMLHADAAYRAGQVVGYILFVAIVAGIIWGIVRLSTRSRRRQPPPYPPPGWGPPPGYEPPPGVPPPAYPPPAGPPPAGPQPPADGAGETER